MSPSLLSNPTGLPASLDAYSDTELLRQLDVLLHARDPLRFALDVLAHHFSLAIAPLHRQIVALAFPGSESQAREGESSLPCSTSLPPAPPKFSTAKIGLSVSPTRSPLLLGLAAPRGFAKSTLCSFLLPLWSICHNSKHFIILISNTHAQAKKFLQMIRYELETNQTLQRTYPALTPHKDKWSDEEIELKRNGKLAHKILAIGAGAQLRGLRFLQYRPDLIILDDVENEELVDSEIRRDDLKAWLDRTVLHVNAQADIVLIGTVLHEMSLLNRVVRQQLDEDKRAYGHWTRRVFQALELEASTWEAYQSTEALQRLRVQDPEAFTQEKQNEPVGLGYKSFDKPEFWTEARFRADWPSELSISITCDPASTNREYSDETAIVVAGWDHQARLWVLDIEHDKYTEPNEIIDRLLVHWVRWSAHHEAHPTHTLYALGIGKIAFQKYLMQQFKQVCALRKLHPYVVELKEDRDKTRRIRQLVPLFAQDRIVLRPEQTYLEQQLRAFPKGRYDDVCCSAGTRVATRYGEKRIEDITVGERVLTPLGWRRVLASGQTGTRPVIERYGLRATWNHSVFVHQHGFIPLNTLAYHDKIDTLTWNGLIHWAYRIGLSGMASSTNGWGGRDAITLASRQPMRGGSIRKDCMWRCGKLLRGKQLRQAITFIIEMAIRLTTTLITWSVYRLATMLASQSEWIEKRIGNYCNRFVHWLRHGIDHLKAVDGIGSMLVSSGTILVGFPASVGLAERCFSRFIEGQRPAHMLVHKRQDEPAVDGTLPSSVLSVISPLSKIATDLSRRALDPADKPSDVPVYNLTVEGVGVYYANGVLVSNCDALTHHLAFGHLLPQSAQPETPHAATTFKDYVDLAEAWKQERERLAPFNVDASFVPMLFN